MFCAFLEEMHGAGKAPPKITADGLRKLASEISEGMFQLAAEERAAGHLCVPTVLISAFRRDRAVLCNHKQSVKNGPMDHKQLADCLCTYATHERPFVLGIARPELVAQGLTDQRAPAITSDLSEKVSS